jgi:acetyl-CoA acetyltransferase
MSAVDSQEAVIVGVGESRLGQHPGWNALALQREAALAALADAGLALGDVDGLLTSPLRVATWAMPCAVVAEGLGLRPRYMATLDVAGATGTSMLHHAAMAIASGQCDTVLCVNGQNLLSHSARAGAVQKMADAGWAHPDYEGPYGPLLPSLYAMLAQRHMHEFGTTPEQMAQVAVQMRANAALNPLAQKKEPITVSDVLASRMITSPFHMLDCSVVSDGAAAYVVTRKDRARDLRQPPVKLLGQGYGYSHTYIGDSPDIVRTGAAQSGADAFAMAGLTPKDVDVAQLYDCFTITVIVELEDLGFCPKGEGGRFVEDGHISLSGSLPVTTHGGLLSAVHPGTAGGMFHVIEGVRQLRGQCGPRQVDGAEVVLVHGNGGIIGLHCTALLGRA